jgi:hypothetical protein
MREIKGTKWWSSSLLNHHHFSQAMSLNVSIHLPKDANLFHSKDQVLVMGTTYHSHTYSHFDWLLLLIELGDIIKSFLTFSLHFFILVVFSNNKM